MVRFENCRQRRGWDICCYVSLGSELNKGTKIFSKPEGTLKRSNDSSANSLPSQLMEVMLQNYFFNF